MRSNTPMKRPIYGMDQSAKLCIPWKFCIIIVALRWNNDILQRRTAYLSVCVEIRVHWQKFLNHFSYWLDLMVRTGVPARDEHRTRFSVLPCPSSRTPVLQDRKKLKSRPAGQDRRTAARPVLCSSLVGCHPFYIQQKNAANPSLFFSFLPLMTYWSFLRKAHILWKSYIFRRNTSECNL